MSRSEQSATDVNSLSDRATARDGQRVDVPNFASEALGTFLAGAGTLTLQQRRLIVDQALLIIESNYVHLPLKEAMHAANPVRRLRMLRTRLDRQTASTMEPEWLFHSQVSSIFHSTRDLHTNYLLPAPFAGQIAFLPFRIEKAHDAGADHYLVTRIVGGFHADGFGIGAEITHWNGTPIARAVAVNGARFAGSNDSANLARGLDSLTLRPLVIQLPPEEEWVTVSFVGGDGVARELRAPWQIATNLPPVTDHDAVSVAATSMGLDLDSDEKSRAMKLLYRPDVVTLEDGQTSAELVEPVAVEGADIATTMPGVFRAREVSTTSGTFGYVRIFTFSVEDPVAFRDEFVRLTGLLPRRGLIVDVRDNGGGHIFASEFLLQTMTPRAISPEPVQFISTPLNLRIVRRHKNNPTGQIDLGPWFESIEQATETGATYSAAHPITPAAEANEIGQTYHGPVVLITDARCYSATDIFAAGFADHQVGRILGVDDNTGAGGANVWTHGLLSALLRVPEPADAESPYRALPSGANLRTAIRRTLRVGAAAGTPVEDLGVRPDAVHRMTRNDVLGENVDLLAAAGQLLASMPVRRLDVVVGGPAAGVATVDLTVAGIDRIDLYLDSRPRVSEDVADGGVHMTIADVVPGQKLSAYGFAAGELVAARLVTI
ncbi:S41 family peptidase [Nocardia sp. NPDC050710]|uniref:S41 family peptidase n=1 Tax=Nocardia sp. NPDC050710 TaxID=3157220 RepID=UPI0033DB36C0